MDAILLSLHDGCFDFLGDARHRVCLRQMGWIKTLLLVIGGALAPPMPVIRDTIGEKRKWTVRQGVLYGD